MSVSSSAVPDDTEPARFTDLDHVDHFTDLDYVPLPDELPAGQRWSTWDDIGIVAGPEPWPDWANADTVNARAPVIRREAYLFFMGWDPLGWCGCVEEWLL